MDSEIYSEIIGKGQPMVLLHGWGFHSEIYRSLANQLALRYQVTLIDLPGFGRSPSLSQHYEIADLAHILLKHTPKNAIWIGWSLGGLIALWVAYHFPESIYRLVTVACSPKFVMEKNWPGIEAGHLKAFANDLSTNYKKTMLRFLVLQSYLCEDSRISIKIIKNKILSNEAPKMFALESGLKLLEETDLRQLVKKIRCPLLQIFGELDTLVPESVSKILKKLMPYSSNYIIKGAGHIPFLSHESCFLNLLNRFLI